MRPQPNKPRLRPGLGAVMVPRPAPRTAMQFVVSGFSGARSGRAHAALAFGPFPHCRRLGVAPQSGCWPDPSLPGRPRPRPWPQPWPLLSITAHGSHAAKVHALTHSHIHTNAGRPHTRIHLQQNHGIPWKARVYRGVPWYNGIPWYTMAYHGIPW